MVKLRLPKIFGKPRVKESPPPPLPTTVYTRRFPKDFIPIDKYPLYDPFAHAVIMQNEETGEILYFLDELPLTRREQKIYNMIVDTLQWELKPRDQVDMDPTEYFKRQARKVIHQYRISLGRLAGISWSKILYYVERNIIGYGPIDPLMKDPNIEDISCDGVNKPIYVWHRKYESVPTNIVFHKEEELDELIMRMAHLAGKHISSAFPILDTMLPGMHRLAATFRKEVSTHGSTFTIRKFKEEPFSIVDLLNFKTIDPLTAAYMWLAMEHKMTTFIIGVTGSGKTSTLNALATLFHPSIKIVTIEDTPELRLPLENWVQLVSRPSYGIGPEKIGEITLYDLVKVSLRYRPDIIIVGEVRGEEAYVLFQAIASVSYDTPITVRSLGGKVEKIPIGEFVDRYYKEGEERVAKNVDGYEVLSHEGYRAVWKPVKYVLRHPTSKIYRIKCEGGTYLKATGSHSVFILEPETMDIKFKRVDNLNVGDLLLTLDSSTFSDGGLTLYMGDMEVSEATLGGLLNLKVSEKKAPVKPLKKLCSRAGINGIFSRDEVLVRADEARELLGLLKVSKLSRRDRELLLKIGEYLEGSLNILRVEEVVREDYEGYVYDLSVPGTESFFGGEVPILLHNTGHGGLSTIHAESVEAAVKRLISPPMNIPEGYIPLMNLALIIKRIRMRPKGEKFERVVRRITGVYEVWDFGKYVEISKWDPFHDEFETYFEKSKILKNISETIGKTVEELREEIDRRRTVLEWMMLKNIRNYKEAANIFRKYYAKPEALFRRASEEVAIAGKPI